MARTTLRHIVFGLTATGFLAACVEGAGTGAGVTSDGAAPAKVRVGQEIEAPDVFQATESALWDGRPSLGGTWVASPDAVDPERVVMFNPASGKSVTGALFRRERENPGPRLQLSSDAAEALGVLAGQPTEIRVVALRKQEAPEEVVAEAPAVAEGEAADPAGAVAAGAEDAAATAAAAVAALDAVDAGAADGADAGAAAGTEADPAAAAVEPAPLTWKERRAKAKAEREAKKAAAAAAKAEAAAAESGAEAGAGAAGAAAATAESAGVAEIVSAPLDARTPEAGAEPAKAPAKPKATEKVAEPVEAAPAPSGAVRPIQIASFSKEENAIRAVEALAKIGITAQAQKSEKAGKIVWGVVANGDAAMLQGIKDAGFADAYFLK